MATIVITLSSSPACLCKRKPARNPNTNPSLSPLRLPRQLVLRSPWRIPSLPFGRGGVGSRALASSPAPAARRRPVASSNSMEVEGDDLRRRILQTLLWIAEGVYILWLFVFPYAPGDPVWAISSDTISSLVSEGLFNFVIGWTFMFAPLLFTDSKRDRYKGSLDVLWGLQMFLTNTFLIPYMAIRLNDADANADAEYTPRKLSQLASAMTSGAPVVGSIGVAICMLCVWWSLFGRADGNFGNLAGRWEFFIDYLGSERLAYAFIWDIFLYMIFQPCLIGDNIQNIRKDRVSIVNYLRFVPVIGLFAYLVCLNTSKEES